MNNYKVYVHINKINNKVYVGLTRQSCEERWRDGKGYKTQEKFYRAIQKYGWNNFEHIILFDNLTEEEASQKEIELIQYYDSYNNGYNSDLGGSTINHSPETLEKMRQSMLGKRHTQETKDKISQSKNDEKVSVLCIETQIIYQSLADAEKATGIDKSTICKCCQGINLSAGGFTWRYADKDKYELFKSTIENRKNKAQKAVICLDTNKVYSSVTEAAQDTNSDASNIAKVCRGKYKQTNGLRWKYIN